jgi:hypothetical protein
MTYVDAHLYSGATRVGTSTNPLYVTFADAPAEFVPTFVPKKEDLSPLFEEKVVVKEVIKEVIKEVTKEVPVYNICGKGILFSIWLRFGRWMMYVQ